MTEALPPDQVRVSDTDRKMVEETLRAAHGEGFITLAEYDERLASVWQAKTRGDLAKVIMDIPADARPAPPVVRAPRPPVRNPKAIRVLTSIWLAISLVNVVVWGLVCITNFELVYPWWVWVVAPTGAVLAAIWWMFGSRPNPKPNDND